MLCAGESERVRVMPLGCVYTLCELLLTGSAWVYVLVMP